MLVNPENRACSQLTWSALFLSPLSSYTLIIIQSAEQPLDVTDAVREGTNSLRIIQLKNMVDVVFALYASPPTLESLAAAVEWERQRKLFSFRQPPLRRLFR
jgi:hypothetical protein